MAKKHAKFLIQDDITRYSSGNTYNDVSDAPMQLLRVHEELHKTKPVCFYDMHPFEHESIGLPCRYHNRIFTVWGHFCSYECARSYAIETNVSGVNDRKISMLALMAAKAHGKYYKVERAPNKLLLNMFGGPLDINQWRSELKSNRQWVEKECNYRTYLTYECYLNQECFSSSKPPGKNSNRSTNTAENKDIVGLKRGKTPAHVTKRSLMQLVHKS